MKRQLAALVLLAATVSACGTSSSSPGASEGPPAGLGSGSLTGTPTPDPLTPMSPPPVGQIQALRTTAAPMTSSTRLMSIPWQFLRLADGGRKVEILLEYGGCTSFDYAQVAQESGSVEITTWASTPISRTAICPALAAVLRGSITLHAPVSSLSPLSRTLSSP
jgi:hypothetical protein